MSISSGAHTQRGIAHIAVILACVVIVGIFAIGWTVARRQNTTDTSLPQDLPAARDADNDQAAIRNTGWNIDGSGVWKYGGGTPPRCPSPLLSYSPSDTARATDIGLPGQYRGTHYKAHGGIRFDGSKATDIVVKLPMDATLVGLKRYIETGELQHLLEFEHPCGIRMRFDHVATLLSPLQAIAETTPEPTEDTRSQPTPELFGQQFKAGAVIGTSVGQPANNNIGYDFGLYDLRKQNAISKNSAWAELHRNESAYNFYGVCWLPLLPKPHAQKLTALIGSNPTGTYISDYCEGTPGGSTMQYNGGRL